MRVTRRNNNLTDITGTRHIITGVKTDVNQAVVTGTARNAMGSFVLATLPLRKHDLDSPSNLGLVLLPSNVVNELDKLLVAILDDRFWNLSFMTPAGVLGRMEYWNVKAAENLDSSTIRIVSAKSLSVSPGKPTMISVVIAA